MVVGSLSIDTDVIVIGSGPGGYVAAIRAAQLGLDVTLVEKHKSLGGVCLNVGCIPTKALIKSASEFFSLREMSNLGINIENVNLDINKMNSWKNNIVSKLSSGIKILCEKNGVEIIEGVASFNSKNSVSVSGQSDVNTINFKYAIVATGSTPIQIPNFKFDSNYILSSTDVLNLKEIPKKMVVIGGGYIGCELGIVLGKLGCEVHILEGTERLISTIDKDVVDVMAKKIKNFNVNVHYNSLAKNVEKKENSVLVHFEENNEKKIIGADKVLVVVGRKPNSANLGLEKIGVEIDNRGFIKTDNQKKTNVENIFAIGDVSSNPMLAHKAFREAKIAAEVISGKNIFFDNKAIPSVVFTDPEIISVGLGEEEAINKGYDVIVKKFPFSALGRAYMYGGENGFIKAIVNKQNNQILGVCGVGPNISEIVSEATLAIEMCANIEDLALTIHPHPTISESMGEVADVILGEGIHIYEPRKVNKDKN